MLSRSKLQNAVEEDWSPEDFLHLLTQACTTRKTGDVEFHRLLGQIIARHLEDLDDLARLQNLDGVDIPPEVSTSMVVSSVERVRSLEQKVQYQSHSINFLEKRKAALEDQVSNAHGVHKTLSSYSECRNSTCGETFCCHIEQDGIKYNLRCSRCRCRHS